MRRGERVLFGGGYVCASIFARGRADAGLWQRRPWQHGNHHDIVIPRTCPLGLQRAAALPRPFYRQAAGECGGAFGILAGFGGGEISQPKRRIHNYVLVFVLRAHVGNSRAAVCVFAARSNL